MNRDVCRCAILQHNGFVFMGLGTRPCAERVGVICIGPANLELSGRSCSHCPRLPLSNEFIREMLDLLMRRILPAGKETNRRKKNAGEKDRIVPVSRRLGRQLISICFYFIISFFFYIRRLCNPVIKHPCVWHRLP